MTVCKANREVAASLLRLCLLLEGKCCRSCIALCKVDSSWVIDMLACKGKHVTQSKVAMMSLCHYCQPDWTWNYPGDTPLGGFLNLSREVPLGKVDSPWMQAGIPYSFFLKYIAKWTPACLSIERWDVSVCHTLNIDSTSTTYKLSQNMRQTSPPVHSVLIRYLVITMQKVTNIDTATKWWDTRILQV